MITVTNRLIVWGVAALFSWSGSRLAVAQQHRATRLGNPATRFAPALRSADEVRALFGNPALGPDIAAIVRQVAWPGRLADLLEAAQTAPIHPLSLPVGTRMPFMASRAQGKPVALRDVLWAGQAPVPAYAFSFSSNGRRYRCVVPAPCSNFYIEELGPDPPQLDLDILPPAEGTVCGPVELRLIVRNRSARPLTRVRVNGRLPAGLQLTDGQRAFNLDAGNLQPAHGMQYRIRVLAQAAGSYVSSATATCAEGAQAQATARIQVQAPQLALECQLPAQEQVGRPVQVCLRLRNTGSAPEPAAILTLTPSQGATAVQADGGTVTDQGVTWKGLSLGPGETRQFCAVFTGSGAGELTFAALAQGQCAQPTQTQCATRLVGVPGMLLEVVDLEDPVEVSNRVVYLIRVLNQGSAPLTGLRLTCTLPEAQQFLSGSGATAVAADGPTVTTEPLPTLPPKAEAAWQVEVLAIAPGDVRFHALLRCDQFDRPIEETEATRQY